MNKSFAKNFIKILLVITLVTVGVLMPSCSCDDIFAPGFVARDEYVSLYAGGQTALDFDTIPVFEALTETTISIDGFEDIVESSVIQYNTSNSFNPIAYYYSHRFAQFLAGQPRMQAADFAGYDQGKAYYPGGYVNEQLTFAGFFEIPRTKYLSQMRLFDPEWISSFEGTKKGSLRTVNGFVRQANVADVFEFLCDYTAGGNNYAHAFDLDFSSDSAPPSATITTESTTFLQYSRLRLSAYDRSLGRTITMTVVSNYRISNVTVQSVVAN